MISNRFDIFEFFQSVDSESFQDVIVACEREATKAERLAAMQNVHNESPSPGAAGYASDLKQAIFSLRYGARPAGFKPEIFKVCSLIRNSHYQ